MSKKKIEEPIRVYIEYDESRSGGEAIDPEEEWSSHEDVNVDVNFIRLHREPPQNRFFYDSIELPNNKMLQMDKLFLAVVRYGTGDSFGHTNGAWYIVGIAPTYQIAQAMLEEETKPSDPPKKGGWQHYKRWEGYFESLDGTEIHELSLV